MCAWVWYPGYVLVVCERTVAFRLSFMSVASCCFESYQAWPAERFVMGRGLEDCAKAAEENQH